MSFVVFGLVEAVLESPLQSKKKAPFLNYDLYKSCLVVHFKVHVALIE